MQQQSDIGFGSRLQLRGLLCLLLLVSATLSAVGEPTGKISRLTITGNVHIPTATILAVITEKVGTPYDPQVAAKDQAAIKAMGLFDGAVGLHTTSDTQGGVDVIFTVKENPVVKKIVFTANTLDKRPSVPASLLTEQMGTKTSQILNTNTLITDLDRLFRYQGGFMRQKGYIVSVSKDINIEPKTGVLTIPLIEEHITQIVIKGNQHTPTAQILSWMHSKPGKVLNENTLTADMKRIYAQGGFTQVGAWQVQPNAIGEATVTVPVVETQTGPGHVSTISYESGTNGVPIIPVRINGTYTAHLLVDTKDTLTCFTPSLAARLGLKPQPLIVNGKRYPIDGKPGNAVIVSRLQLGDNPHVFAGDVTMPLYDLTAISAQAGQTLDGAFSSNALASVAWGVDFVRHQMTFWDHGHLTAAERAAAGFAGAVAVPLNIPDDASDGYSVKATLENKGLSTPVTLYLGTNYTASTISRADAQALRVQIAPGIGQTNADSAGLDHIRLGGVTINAPLFKLNASPSPAVLGMDILSRYRILLDGPAKMLYLAPAVKITARTPSHIPIVPFTYNPVTTGVPVVQVSINGHSPMPFIFDTGTGTMLVIDQTAAARLGLVTDTSSGGTVNVTIPTSRALVAQAVIQGKSRADDVLLSPVQAQVVKLRQLQGIMPGGVVGIIGAGILTNTPVRFDFQTHTLTFFLGHSAPPLAPGDAVLPLTVRQSPNAYFVTGTPSQGKPVEMVVDSGSEATEIPYSAHLPFQSARETGEEMLAAFCLGEELRMSGFTLGNLTINHVRLDALPTATAGFWNPPTLGLNLLSRFRVTFDVPGMRLVLEALPHSKPPFRSGWSGLALTQTGTTFTISKIAAKSPAALAGLRKGERVLSIDGQHLAGQSLYIAERLADGEANTTAVFRVQRGTARPRTVRFRRKDDFQQPPSPLLGLIGIQKFGGALAVIAVTPGSPVDRAGIKPGDTITSVNGIPAASLVGDGWKGLYLDFQRVVTMTVQQASGGPARTVRLITQPEPSITTEPSVKKSALNQ